ncbi:MAG: hypothetical protein HQ502_00130 [Alphaproteobacteria bacterium]|nr:hypothetical protein [Alphaproteobacteria bacterium]
MECAVNCRLKGRLEVWAKKAPRHMVLLKKAKTTHGFDIVANNKKGPEMAE